MKSRPLSPNFDLNDWTRGLDALLAPKRKPKAKAVRRLKGGCLLYQFSVTPARYGLTNQDR